MLLGFAVAAGGVFGPAKAPVQQLVIGEEGQGVAELDLRIGKVAVLQIVEAVVQQLALGFARRAVLDFLLNHQALGVGLPGVVDQVVVLDEETLIKQVAMHQVLELRHLHVAAGAEFAIRHLVEAEEGHRQLILNRGELQLMGDLLKQEVALFHFEDAEFLALVHAHSDQVGDSLGDHLQVALIAPVQAAAEHLRVVMHDFHQHVHNAVLHAAVAQDHKAHVAQRRDHEVAQVVVMPGHALAQIAHVIAVVVAMQLNHIAVVKVLDFAQLVGSLDSDAVGAPQPVERVLSQRIPVGCIAAAGQLAFLDADGIHQLGRAGEAALHIALEEFGAQVDGRVFLLQRRNIGKVRIEPLFAADPVLELFGGDHTALGGVGLLEDAHDDLVDHLL